MLLVLLLVLLLWLSLLLVMLRLCRLPLLALLRFFIVTPATPRAQPTSASTAEALCTSLYLHKCFLHKLALVSHTSPCRRTTQSLHLISLLHFPHVSIHLSLRLSVSFPTYRPVDTYILQYKYAHIRPRLHTYPPLCAPPHDRADTTPVAALGRQPPTATTDSERRFARRRRSHTRTTPKRNPPQNNPNPLSKSHLISLG